MKLTLLSPDDIKSRQSIARQYFFLFEINSEDIGISKLKSQLKLLPSSWCAFGYHPLSPLINTTTPFFAEPTPFKSANCPSPSPFLGNSLLFISFSWPPINQIFSEPA